MAVSHLIIKSCIIITHVIPRVKEIKCFIKNTYHFFMPITPHIYPIYLKTTLQELTDSKQEFG